MIVGKDLLSKKIDATEGGGGWVIEANYKGRITGSWATRQPSLFSSSREKRAIHVVRELFVLRRIGNIIIGVIASQNPSRTQKGWWAVSAATPRVRARTWNASKHWWFVSEDARSSLTIWGMFLKRLSSNIQYECCSTFHVNVRCKFIL